LPYGKRRKNNDNPSPVLVENRAFLGLQA